MDEWDGMSNNLGKHRRCIRMFKCTTIKSLHGNIFINWMDNSENNLKLSEKIFAEKTKTINSANFVCFQDVN